MIKKILFILFIMSGIVHAQPEIEWEQYYYERPFDYWCFSSTFTFDGGIVMAGNKYDPIEADTLIEDGLAIKTNSNGDLIWRRSYGERLSREGFYTVITIADSGFVFGGRSEDSMDFPPDSVKNPPNAAYLVRTNNNGEIIWERRYTLEGGGTIRDVAQIEDGGFYLAGSARSYAFLMKVDEDGDSLWYRNWGGDEYDTNIFERVFVLENGDIVLAGCTESFGCNVLRDFFLVKTDENGEEIWLKTYGTEGDEYFGDAIRTDDGGFAMVGFVVFEDALYIVKTDSDGEEEWTRTHHHNEDPDDLSMDFGDVILQVPDGGFLIGGCTGYRSQIPLLLFRIDSCGDRLWSGRYSEGSIWGAQSMLHANNGGYYVAGKANAGTYLLKTEPDPVTVPRLLDPSLPNGFELHSPYPNPFNSTTTITYGLSKPSPTRLVLNDLSGRRVMTLFNGNREAGIFTTTLIADNLPSGLYVVRLDAAGQQFTQKIMLLK
ncbi:T9SS type A sorting domain-containing protein [bacterium]|nr:T9SS type A sorting domain-containing protein [bacterium]